MSAIENNCWLSDILIYNSNEDWEEYEDTLYEIFKADFLSYTLNFRNKPIQIRIHPKEYNREEAFYHVTTVNSHDKTNRYPDYRRCERIKWLKEIIENLALEVSKCNCGDDLKVWLKDKRWHILCEKQQFLIVLEEREEYVLLITAYYIDHEHTLRKKLKEHAEYNSSL